MRKERRREGGGEEDEKGEEKKWRGCGREGWRRVEKRRDEEDKQRIMGERRKMGKGGMEGM